MKAIKYILGIMILSLMFPACETTTPVERGKAYFDGMPIDVISFDGCEYVFMRGGRSKTLTHKGNCRFCAQRENITKLNGKSK